MPDGWERAPEALIRGYLTGLQIRQRQEALERQARAQRLREFATMAGIVPLAVLRYKYPELARGIPEPAPPLEEILPSPEEIEQQTKTLKPADIDKLIPLLLPACIVKPKVTLSGGKDSLAIDDITWEDQLKLLEEIFEFSGLTREAERSRNL